MQTTTDDAPYWWQTLSRALLRSGFLRGADLRGADLSGAVLTRALLRSGFLSGVDLTGADLTRADLRGAILSGVDLTDAVLTRADLSDAVLSDVRGLPSAPVIPDLDRRILDQVQHEGGALDMGQWHTCSTTHCRAGWAITLAGAAGAELEDRLGPSAAGALIYHASTGRVPDFYASTEDALEDLRRCAGVPS